VKILLIGYNLPTFQGRARLEAAHYRAWQFTQPLLDDGHAVALCVPSSSAPPEPDALPPNLTWHTAPYGARGWPAQLQAVHDAVAPDGIVAVDFYPSLWATKLQTTAPIWMDLYGDPMTILQVDRYRRGNDQGLWTHIALLGEVLRRGDAFSTCGLPQKHMLVGELALSGRLTHLSFGHEFVHPIYPGAAPVTPSGPETRAEKRAFLGIGPEDFVVLWAGGYNAWTDDDTLFRALEQMMAENPRAHFVSAGASTYEAPETTYARLEARSAASQYRDRYHLLGWQPWQEIPSLYAASDIGISIDALHYETVYGTRTRLVEMFAYGLPVITSEGAELSYLIPGWGCGVTYPTGDWETLARELLALSGDPPRVARMAAAATATAQGPLSFRATTTPLRAWAAGPAPAPDRLSGEAAGAEGAAYKARTEARKLLWRVGGLYGKRA